MPFLEPYLIETMKKAKERITDPQLLKDVDLHIAQEATTSASIKQSASAHSEAKPQRARSKARELALPRQ